MVLPLRRALIYVTFAELLGGKLPPRMDESTELVWVIVLEFEPLNKLVPFCPTAAAFEAAPVKGAKPPCVIVLVFEGDV